MRWECLDWLIPLNQRHLRQVLTTCGAVQSRAPARQHGTGDPRAVSGADPARAHRPSPSQGQSCDRNAHIERATPSKSPGPRGRTTPRQPRASFLRSTGRHADNWRTTVIQMILCACAAFVVLVVLRWEGLPLQSIGLRRFGWRTFATALLLTTIGFVLQALVTAPLVKAFGQAGANAGVATLALLPTWFRLFLATTSGIVEETLYRGYAVERFAAITGRRWLGATLATAAFTAAHIPFWGVQFALVADLPVGILLVLSYLWRRDLVANMLSHSAWLVVALLTHGTAGELIDECSRYLLDGSCH